MEPYEAMLKTTDFMFKKIFASRDAERSREGDYDPREDADMEFDDWLENQEEYLLNEFIEKHSETVRTFIANSDPFIRWAWKKWDNE